MRSAKWIVPAIAAMLVASGCNDTTGPADAGFEEAALALIDGDGLTGEIVFVQLFLGGFGFEGGLGVNGDTRDFSRTRDCPAGGSVSVTGQVERTQSGEGAVEFTVNATGAWNECAHTRGDRTRTVSGNFTLQSSRKLVNREPVGPQVTTKSGSFTVTRSDGESRSCDFSITSTRLPDAGKRMIKGTVCGREIDREVSWKKSEG